MSVKRTLILAAATASAVLTTAALAGGPDVAPVAPAFQPFIYVEAHAGYAWESEQVSQPTLPNETLSYSTQRNGFAYGADLGYMFVRNFGLEAGYFYLPKSKVNINYEPVGEGFSANFKYKTNSYLLYVAARATMPIFQSLDVFAKLGLGYRHMKYYDSSALYTPINGGYWAPVVAAGLSYSLNTNWSLGAQYMFIPKHSKATRPAGSVSLLTGYVGYSFSV